MYIVENNLNNKSYAYRMHKNEKMLVGLLNPGFSLLFCINLRKKEYSHVAFDIFFFQYQIYILKGIS